MKKFLLLTYIQKIVAFIGCFEKGFAILFVKIALKFISSLIRTKNGRFVGFVEKIIIIFQKISCKHARHQYPDIVKEKCSWLWKNFKKIFGYNLTDDFRTKERNSRLSLIWSRIAALQKTFSTYMKKLKVCPPVLRNIFK